MMIKNSLKIALCLFVVALPMVAAAQVAKQVEVTKAYVPEVAEAVKLPVEPNMVDTVKMRPEIEYSISPKMYATDLATHRFKPATVTYWSLTAPRISISRWVRAIRSTRWVTSMLRFTILVWVICWPT